MSKVSGLLAPSPGYALSGASRSNGSQSSANVVDRNPATLWTSSQTTPRVAWVTVKLDRSRTIGEIRWMWGLRYRADRVRIEVSRDQETWTRVATISNAPTGQWQSLEVEVYTKYIRFRFENPNRDKWVGGLAEVEDYPAESVAARKVTPTPRPTTQLIATPRPTTQLTAPPQPTAQPTATSTAQARTIGTAQPTATATLQPTATATRQPTVTPQPTATVTTTLGTTWYVSSSGSDANPGTVSKPFKTVQVGLNLLRPGDRLILRGGTYYPSAPLTFPLTGTSAYPISVENYPGETPVIDGKGVLTAIISTYKISSIVLKGLTLQNSGGARGKGIELWSTTNVKMQGLVIQNVPQAAIYIDEGSSNVTISNCDLSGAATGVDIRGRDVTVDGCRSHDNNRMINNGADCDGS